MMIISTTRSKRFLGLCFSLCLAGWIGPATAQDAEPCATGPATMEYLKYLLDHSCGNPDQTDCLEPTSYIATRSDGRKVLVDGVYRWRSANSVWPDPSGIPQNRLLPHFLLGYLRVLRNAYQACPSDYFHTKLFDQIDYMMSQTVRRPATADAVLPPRVWENRYGITQGMEQAEMAAFLASASEGYAMHGAKEARGTMRYAFETIEPLFIPVGIQTGGVRSEVQDVCGAKAARFRKGYWFHSRGVGIDTAGEDMIPTVLNQHLHAIVDTLCLMVTVNRNPDLVPAEYGSAANALTRLEDRAIGGLYQLAFSNGNNSAAPRRPPNLRQFMRRDENNGQWFYFSYYRFLMSTRTFSDIKWASTCHYHRHTLEKLADVKAVLDRYPCVFLASPSNDGWRLYEAVDRLFAGQGEPMGQFGSTSAVYQFWLSNIQINSLVGCPVDEDNPEGPVQGMFPHGWSFSPNLPCLNLPPATPAASSVFDLITTAATLSQPIPAAAGIRVDLLPGGRKGISWPLSETAGPLLHRTTLDKEWKPLLPPYLTNANHLSVIRAEPIEFFMLAKP